MLEHFWEHVSRALDDSAGSLDGIFLVLHGAMAAASFPDCEEELVGRLRAHPAAADIPICGVLDLHGNISRATAEGTDGGLDSQLAAEAPAPG